MMDQYELMRITESILLNSKVAVLATSDKSGIPHMRWMSPILLDGRKDSLFAVTSPNFKKVVQAETQPEVEWMIQSKTLDQIVNLKGTIAVVNNPSLKSEVIEKAGALLENFWKLNTENSDFIVLETSLYEGVYYCPLRGRKEMAVFNQAED